MRYRNIAVHKRHEKSCHLLASLYQRSYSASLRNKLVFSNGMELYMIGNYTKYMLGYYTR